MGPVGSVPRVRNAYAFGVLAGRSARGVAPGELAGAGVALIPMVVSDDRSHAHRRQPRRRARVRGADRRRADAGPAGRAARSRVAAAEPNGRTGAGRLDGSARTCCGETAAVAVAHRDLHAASREEQPADGGHRARGAGAHRRSAERVPGEGAGHRRLGRSQGRHRPDRRLRTGALSEGWVGEASAGGGRRPASSARRRGPTWPSSACRRRDSAAGLLPARPPSRWRAISSARSSSTAPPTASPRASSSRSRRTSARRIRPVMPRPGPTTRNAPLYGPPGPRLRLPELRPARHGERRHRAGGISRRRAGTRARTGRRAAADARSAATARDGGKGSRR